MKIIKKLLNLLDRIEIVNEKGDSIFNNSTNKTNHRVIKIEIKEFYESNPDNRR